MSDALRERVTEAAQRAQDELRATTPDGGRALGNLRDMLEEWRRRGDPAASAADRRLIEALETVDLNAPEAIDTLTAALAPEPEPEPDWASVSAPVKRPATIVGLGDGCLIPAGEVGIVAGPGGQGKSRLTLQIALSAAAAKDGSLVAPFKGTGDECLQVAGGPVVATGYEDHPGWSRWRLERIANHLEGSNQEGRYMATLKDPKRLSVAQIDGPLSAPPAHGRRDALPGPTSTWRQTWDRAAAIGARLVVIDPVGLALETVGFDPAPVNAFYRALRSEAVSIECAVLLVAHVTKQGRARGAEIDADAVSGVAAWVDRARCALAMVREDTGKPIVKVVKANYAQQDIVIRLKDVEPDRVAFAAEGADDGEAGTEAEAGNDWRTGIA